MRLLPHSVRGLGEPIAALLVAAINEVGSTNVTFAKASLPPQQSIRKRLSGCA